MLYIIYQSPSESQALENYIQAQPLPVRPSLRGRAVSGRGNPVPKDAILLIENGVFCALRNTTSGNQLLHCAAQKKIFVLAPHAAERGVSRQLINNIHLIDFEGFVDLTVEHYPILRL